jgi:NAD(P)-dependent dehydrogenase (short-subunit alcohol dehydrogenase family)
VINEQSQIKSLDAQVAIVTGAARGIGREIAMRFVKSGWVVHSFDVISPDTISEKSTSSTNLIDHQVNCVDAQAVRTAVQEILDAHSHIDLLVNNAGIGFRSGLEDFPEDQWQRVIDINLTAVFLCM